MSTRPSWYLVPSTDVVGTKCRQQRGLAVGGEHTEAWSAFPVRCRAGLAVRSSAASQAR